MSREPNKPAYVPEGMVAKCPWQAPLRAWSREQLEHGADECDDPFFPTLGRAIHAELADRS